MSIDAFGRNLPNTHGKGLFVCAALFAVGAILPLAAANEVWVSDARGNDATGTGTYDSPYKTIQKGVDEVDAGGTVKILRGIYGEGEEHFAADHTNRVVISKSITLDGVEGKEVTHLVGYLDPATTYGNGPAAIRCIQIGDTAAKNTVIKNLTLRDSGAGNVNELKGYGGAVNYSGATTRSTVCLIDCVISNCAAVMGGGLHGMTAVRCQISACHSTGFGTAARYSRLLHCLILRNKCSGGSGARPMLDHSYAVNCTVAYSIGASSQGIGNDCYAYNCVSTFSGAGDVVTGGSYPVVETNCCYVGAMDAKMLFSPASGDFRVRAGSPADGGGLTEFLTSKITNLPADVEVDVDYAGRKFDMTKETCDAGCCQGAAVPAGGRIVCSSAYEVDGFNLGVTGANAYYTPDTWPVSVRLRPIVDNITNYVYSAPSSASFSYDKMRRIFPTIDGSHLVVPPPDVNDQIALTAYMADMVVYAKPDADPETADGSIDNPYPTLQAAVDAVTNNAASARPLILALPGVYDKGGKVAGGMFTRLVLSDAKHFTVRSTDGAENTVIKGAADESNTGDYAGCGPDAVRCIFIARGTITVTASVVQGFTIADGHTYCDDYKTDTPQYHGGGICGSAKNSRVVQVHDCIITNCAAVRCGASYMATLFRCKIYDCHAFGGVMRSTRLVSCYVDPSCTLGSAPADASENNIFGNSTVSYLTTAPDATAFNDDLSFYNSLFASFAPTSKHTTWGSVTTNIAARASTSGIAYVYDANFADPANGDWRLRTTTKARMACVLPERGSAAYGTWATNFAWAVQGDIDCNPICVTDGVPLPGCWQTTVGEKSMFVEAENDGLVVSGGSIGDNTVGPGAFSVTLSPGIGPRPCCGYTVNGETNLFADVGNRTFTADDVAAGDYGLVVTALYSTNWYVNPAGDDTLNGGSTVATPMKTLAAVMAKVQAGDTVHAAAGTYNQGSTNIATAGWNLATRVIVPQRVTLVADDGPEATFIVGAPEPDPAKANEYGMGTNAMRCVFMGEKTRLKGFTVTGGRTWWNADGFSDTAFGYSGNWSGGGICGHSNGRADVYVEDCIISNNYACWAGGTRFTNLIRCRLFENYATSNGGAIRDAHAYGCVIDRNYSGSGDGRASCYYYTRIVGSTLGPHNYKLDGSDAYAVSGASSNKAIFHDNLVLGSTGAKGNLTNTVTGCVFADSKNGWPTDETCIVVPSSELEVDENLRPIVGRNAAVDRGSAEALSQHSGGLIPSETDALYFPRVINGKMDVGALEGDWRPMYAKILDGKGTRLVVDEASSGIVTNDVGGVAAVELHGGEALSLTWGTASNPAMRRGFVKVTGEGTLTMMLNGAPFGAYTVTDGAAEFAVPAAGLDAFAFSFAFDGEGVADLYGFSAKCGTVFSIR